MSLKDCKIGDKVADLELYWGEVMSMNANALYARFPNPEGPAIITGYDYNGSRWLAPNRKMLFTMDEVKNGALNDYLERKKAIFEAGIQKRTRKKYGEFKTFFVMENEHDDGLCIASKGPVYFSTEIAKKIKNALDNRSFNWENGLEEKKEEHQPEPSKGCNKFIFLFRLNKKERTLVSSGLLSNVMIGTGEGPTVGAAFRNCLLKEGCKRGDALEEAYMSSKVHELFYYQTFGSGLEENCEWLKTFHKVMKDRVNQIHQCGKSKSGFSIYSVLSDVRMCG